MTERTNGLAEIARMVDDGGPQADNVQAIRDKGADIGRTVLDRLDSSRQTVASGLGTAAVRLHDGGNALATRAGHVGHMVHGAADSVAAAGDYVRSHQAGEMWSDLTTTLRAHPGKSLLAAVAVGYLAGRALQRH